MNKDPLSNHDPELIETVAKAIAFGRYGFNDSIVTDDQKPYARLVLDALDIPGIVLKAQKQLIVDMRWKVMPFKSGSTEEAIFKFLGESFTDLNRATQTGSDQ